MGKLWRASGLVTISGSAEREAQANTQHLDMTPPTTSVCIGIIRCDSAHTTIYMGTTTKGELRLLESFMVDRRNLGR